MPRPLGGKWCAKPASKWCFADIVPYAAAAFAAPLLSITLLCSEARAAGDDDPDTGVVAEDAGTYDDAGPSSSRSPSQAAPGGLTVEGLLYRRSDLDTVPFTKPSSIPNIPWGRVDSSQLDGDTYTPGVRATLQGTILDQPVEFSAFFLLPFGSDVTSTGLTDPSFSLPNNPPDIATDMLYQGDGFDSANSEELFAVNVHHETKLFGGEANLVSPFGIPSLVLGARALYFGEQLSTTAMRQDDDYPPLGSDDDRDHAGIRVDNRMIGVQLGLQHMFDAGDVMRIGGSIKGGLYGNFVDRNRSLVSENRQDRSYESTDHDTAFAQGVEINPRVELKLTEGAYLTASGQFLWLNNVSTALPQYANIAQAGDHGVHADDDVFFYGGSLGLTILLDESSPISNSLPPFAPIAPGTSFAAGASIDERIAELEETTARKGNERVSLSISGWVSRMLLAWDDGEKTDVYVVDNVSSRSRVNFDGAVKISRGWSAGYLLSFGLDDTASNDVDQFFSNGEQQIEVRHSAWWIRNSQLGTMTLGHTSTATDNIILKDVGGIMPGAANMATIGGSFLMRHADSYEKGNDALVNSGAFTTTLNDMIAGGSVDTLRRNVIRYDAPRFSGLWGNIDMSVAWGEDDFFDVAVEHGINYDDWKFRFGAGYLHDTDEHGRANSSRDRKEYKGSASLLHIPTGLFGTAAYVRRTFHGYDAATPQAVFGENVSEELNADQPNRPPIDYFYSAFGLRRSYWSIGDTSIYGEYGQVWDSVKGLREADFRAVTESRVMMLGAAICQDIDDAGMDVYAGVRVYSFDTEGLQRRRPNSSTPYTYYTSPVPLTDLMFGYAGARIKF